MPNERSKTTSRRRVGRGRFVPLDRGSEESDPVGGPVGEEGDSDNPAVRNWTPEPAVVRLTTVVPHHEVIAGRNNDRLRKIAVRTASAPRNVGVFLPGAVAVDVPASDRDPVAGTRDHALDEGRGRLARGGHPTGLRMTRAFI